MREEGTIRETFAERFTAARTDAVVDVEREVLGADYGGNGYTTRAQADLLADRLQLGPGRRLLDVGAGCGWPGLYLAATTGCDVVVTDLTVEGMRAARGRAHADGLPDRVSTVAASARHLPFRPECFDAIVHTDVLC